MKKKTIITIEINNREIFVDADNIDYNKMLQALEVVSFVATKSGMANCGNDYKKIKNIMFDITYTARIGRDKALGVDE